MAKITRLDVLLGRMDECTKNAWGADRALYLLLTKYRDRLPALDDYFHKSFRQMDITDSGELDMVIWHLLHSSEVFWKCLKRAKERGAIKRFQEEQ